MRGSRTRGPAAQYNRMTAAIRQAAAAEIGKHRRLLRTGRDGRILSALMLPQLWLATPAGYGVLTTTGRKTGRPRHKCVRVIQRGDRAYLVALRLSHIAVTVLPWFRLGCTTSGPIPTCGYGSAVATSTPGAALQRRFPDGLRRMRPAPARPAHANESPRTAPLLVRDRNPDIDLEEIRP